MKLTKRILLLLTVILLSCNIGYSATPTERPFIWITEAERDGLFEKIENAEWANTFYNAIIERTELSQKEYLSSKENYFAQMPLDWENQKKGEFPSFLKMPSKTNNGQMQDHFANSIAFATDCAFLYYTTREEHYAQSALDILYNISSGLLNTSREGVQKTNGGWIYHNDHLREARYVASLPVVYDFIYPFIASGAKAYDSAKGKNVKVDTDIFQQVFKTYAQMVLDSGQNGSNWSVLESTNLIHCALAIEDIEIRNDLINSYLNVNYPRQDCLNEIAKAYKVRGDIWPETSQYSGHVASMSTNIMYILTHYDPTIGLCAKYANIPWSLPRWFELTFPNGDLVRFGDGKRYLGVHMDDIDMAYSFAKLEGVEDLEKRLAASLITEMEKGTYNRPVAKKRHNGAVSPYIEPLSLIWCEATIEQVKGNDTPLPRTDNLSHAGLYLQRNISSTGNPEDGLMLFVAGASHVHSHAGGMNIELYGKGEVLGVDAGNTSYGSRFHENYSRLYAAHNCVITNGRSGSEGDWVNLGTETVQKVAMEPNPAQEAIADNYSYSVTSYLDNKAPKTDGTQQRTLSVVRTSPTTGYYVDIFRAESPEKDQFHDYLYHNIAKELVINNEDANFEATPERFKDERGQEWSANRSFIYPGWTYFENVTTMSDYSSDINGVFVTPMADKTLNMRFFVLGEENRDYSIVDAPHTFQAPKGYEDQPTPTMVIRKTGEAWDAPFAVIFEPTKGDSTEGSVKSVEKITFENQFKGIKVVSEVAKDKITQYIISNDSVKTTTLPEIDFEFTGRFAIVTLKNGELSEIYAGETKDLRFEGHEIGSKTQAATDLYVAF